jgi:hypothetical protein
MLRVIQTLGAVLQPMIDWLGRHGGEQMTDDQIEGYIQRIKDGVRLALSESDSRAEWEEKACEVMAEEVKFLSQAERGLILNRMQSMCDRIGKPTASQITEAEWEQAKGLARRIRELRRQIEEQEK